MTREERLAACMARKPGPIRKFALVKEFGNELRQAGYDPRKMSCIELERAVEFPFTGNFG